LVPNSFGVMFKIFGSWPILFLVGFENFNCQLGWLKFFDPWLWWSKVHDQNFWTLLKNISGIDQFFWIVTNFGLVVGSIVIFNWMTNFFQIAHKCFFRQVEENLVTDYGDLKLVINFFWHVICFWKALNKHFLGDQRWLKTQSPTIKKFQLLFKVVLYVYNILDIFSSKGIKCFLVHL
jgi:hypothetical protein